MHHLRLAVRVVLLSAALLVGGLAVPGAHLPAAQAAENGAWSVRPTPAKGSATPRNYFILEGAPGDVIKDSVRIQNLTKRTISFRLYGADGYNTDQGGFFALKAYEEKQDDLGTWVKPLTSVLTLAGRTAVDVPVKFTIPENATPGDHVGGVVAMNVQSEAQSDGGVSLGIQRAIGARTYIRVSGTMSPGVEVRDMKVRHDRGALPWAGKGNAEVSWTVENTGNLRLSPGTTITVDGLGKPTVVKIPKLIDLLPGEKVELTQKVTGVGWFAGTDVTVAVDAGDDLVATESITVWAIPWLGILLLALIAAAVAALVVRRRNAMRRRLKSAEAAPKISVVDEETV